MKISYDMMPQVALQIFAHATKQREVSHGVVITLSGDLGSGKTTLAQEICKLLGVVEHVSSPTFVIQKRYALAHVDFDTLVHIDAYRLTKGSELALLGFEKDCENPRTITLLEWPEQVQEVIPAYAYQVALAHVSSDMREIQALGIERV
jgi:tRNA threonylcarbamoyladenosine biosynthesis protein TsaE